MIFGIWPDWLDGLLGGKKTFVSAILNGVTLAGLYFLVASGFTLVFGLMRNVNLAHGSLFLLGAYIGYDAATWSGNWFIGVAAGALAIAAVGALLQIFVFQRLTGDDLRQTLVTIGISIVAADLMLAIWGGKTYQFSIPSMLDGAVATPIITAIKSNGQIVTLRYPFYRLVVLAISLVIGAALWLAINRTRFGAMIRAGVDDRGMLSAAGVNVRLLFVGVFAIGGLLAGLSGVIGGSALSVAPGEDVRYLMASLVVVIVGGMGSITGAAIGALLIGLAEQLGLVYFPTYGVVLTFVIMVVTLALRPQGIMGNARTRLADPPRPPAAGDIVPVEFTPSTAALAVALILFPVVATPFIVFQLGAQTLILGMIALSLTILGGYGGMVSMAQLTVAGVAGYAVAILGPNGTGVLGLNWPWEIYVPVAILVAGIVSALIGAIAVRTAGIYTIMITLAVGVAFFYLAQQNYSLFNGHSGFRGVAPPNVFGVAWRDAIPFYFLCLAMAALAYSAVVYAARSTFGLALMASSRQSAARPRRRLRCHLAADRRLLLRGTYRRGRRRALRLVQRSHFARNGQRERIHRHSRYCRDRRHATPDRTLPRSGALRTSQDLRHRHCRRRSIQHAHRRDLSHHRFCLSRRHSGALAARSTCFGSEVAKGSLSAARGTFKR